MRCRPLAQVVYLLRVAWASVSPRSASERVFVRFAQPTRYPMMSAAKNRASGLSAGQEFDDAPVLLILPVRLEVVFVLRSQDRQIVFSRVFGSKLAIHRRYTVRW